MAEIEDQLAMEENLLEEDQYLMDVNMCNLETTDGGSQTYWHLAVKAAQSAKQQQSSFQAGIG